ncbi:location of vulva defective 1-like isoform X2 [Oncorhynchus keta]|uniref:location of vulva defective 1-like isoform X2 n=1 Tax=Oncorhynchus keta TaxID=8018 RepID=UPI00227CF6AA|nr:location of vulva defective 1-like isoform X2 [Oncorhynchus keta]
MAASAQEMAPWQVYLASGANRLSHDHRGGRWNSICSGEGGYGTRISMEYASSIPVSVTNVSNSLCLNERENMQDLNDRFASYLEKVHQLEAANAQLELQIKEHLESSSLGARKDMGRHLGMIDNLRNQISEWYTTHAQLRLQVANAQLEVYGYKYKCEQEERRLLAAEAELSHLQSIQHEFIDREGDLHIQLDGNLEEMDLLKSNHEEGVQGVMAQMSGLVNVEMDCAHSVELNESLSRLREQCGAMVLKNKTEAESWFRSKVDSMKTQVTVCSDGSEVRQTEIDHLKRKVQDLTLELQLLETQNLSMERDEMEVNERYSIHLSRLQKHLDSLEVELLQLCTATEQQAVQYLMLLDIKSRLEREIAEYRRLLDGGGARKSIPNAMASVTSHCAMSNGTAFQHVFMPIQSSSISVPRASVPILCVPRESVSSISETSRETSSNLENGGQVVGAAIGEQVTRVQKVFLYNASDKTVQSVQTSNQVSTVKEVQSKCLESGHRVGYSESSANTSFAQHGSSTNTSPAQHGASANTSFAQHGSSANTSSAQHGASTNTSSAQHGASANTSSAQHGASAKTSSAQHGASANTSSAQHGAHVVSSVENKTTTGVNDRPLDNISVIISTAQISEDASQIKDTEVVQITSSDVDVTNVNCGGQTPSKVNEEEISIADDTVQVSSEEAVVVVGVSDVKSTGQIKCRETEIQERSVESETNIGSENQIVSTVHDARMISAEEENQFRSEETQIDSMEVRSQMNSCQIGTQISGVLSVSESVAQITRVGNGSQISCVETGAQLCSLEINITENEVQPSSQPTEVNITQSEDRFEMINAEHGEHVIIEETILEETSCISRKSDTVESSRVESVGPVDELEVTAVVGDADDEGQTNCEESRGQINIAQGGDLTSRIITTSVVEMKSADEADDLTRSVVEMVSTEIPMASSPVEFEVPIVHREYRAQTPLMESEGMISRDVQMIDHVSTGDISTVETVVVSFPSVSQTTDSDNANSKGCEAKETVIQVKKVEGPVPISSAEHGGLITNVVQISSAASDNTISSATGVAVKVPASTVASAVEIISDMRSGSMICTGGMTSVGSGGLISRTESGYMISSAGSGHMVTSAGSGHMVTSAGSGHMITSAGSGHMVTSAGSGHMITSAGSGHMVTSAGSGHMITSAGSGHMVTSAGSGHMITSAGSGHMLTSAGSGHMITSAGSGHMVTSAGSGHMITSAGSGHMLTSGGSGEWLVYGGGTGRLSGPGSGGRLSGPGSGGRLSGPGSGGRLSGPGSGGRLSGPGSGGRLSGPGSGGRLSGPGSGGRLSGPGNSNGSGVWTHVNSESVSQFNRNTSNERTGRLSSTGSGEWKVYSGSNGQISKAGSGGRISSAGSGHMISSAGSGHMISSAGSGHMISSAGSGHMISSAGSGHMISSAASGGRLRSRSTGSGGSGHMISSAGSGGSGHMISSAGSGGRLSSSSTGSGGSGHMISSAGTSGQRISSTEGGVRVSSGGSRVITSSGGPASSPSRVTIRNTGSGGGGGRERISVCKMAALSISAAVKEREKAQEVRRESHTKQVSATSPRVQRWMRTSVEETVDKSKTDDNSVPF